MPQDKQKYKQIRCLEQTHRGPCGAFLGNISCDMQGAVQFLCRNYKDHDRHDVRMIEVVQTNLGNVIQVGQHHDDADYLDDNVRAVM